AVAARALGGMGAGAGVVSSGCPGFGRPSCGSVGLAPAGESGSLSRRLFDCPSFSETSPRVAGNLAGQDRGRSDASQPEPDPHPARVGPPSPQRRTSLAVGCPPTQILPTHPARHAACGSRVGATESAYRSGPRDVLAWDGNP